MVHRAGNEPLQARSPLRLRSGLAAFGVVCAAAGAVAFAMIDHPGWALVCAIVAVVAALDLVIVIWRIRQGPHYQPGRDVPPYEPARSQDIGRTTGRHRKKR
ncbi:DUF6343 family protein [Streptomyces sp. NPDC003077]|uniref:DUF6343 family protein n=1 Tax=Streptomyces sp. NPDC003077 TaxID=3154443 RepID=UPI0033BC9621